MSWAALSPIRAIFGILFVGYNGFSTRKSVRHIKTCLDPQGAWAKLQVTYAFPVWFLSYALQVAVKLSLSRHLSFSVKVARRVETLHGSITSDAVQGSTTDLKRKLETNRETLFDIDKIGRNAMHFVFVYAKGPQSFEKFRMLYQAGMDMDTPDDYGLTPRHLLATAICHNTIPFATLTDEIFRLASGILDQLTLVQRIVCGICSVDLSAVLEGLGPRVAAEIDETGEIGQTALHIAVARDDIEVVRVLINAGANVEAETLSGLTPLHVAAGSGSARSTKALLDAGADPCKPCRLLPLSRPIGRAVAAGNLETVRLLVSAGADVNGRIVGDSTLLSFAIAFHHMEIAQYLYDEGAKINPMWEEGVVDMPLSYAVQVNNTAALAFLLDHGAKYIYANTFGNTVLHLVAMFGNIETMDILTSRKLHGLDVHAKNRKDMTAVQEFESRALVSDELRKAFQRLLSSVELPVTSQGHFDDDIGDVFVDAVESLND